MSKKLPTQRNARLRAAKNEIRKLFKRVPVGKRPTRSEISSLSLPETGSGKGGTAPNSPFVKKEPAQTMVEAPVNVTQPRFLRALIERNADDEEILRQTFARDRRTA